MTETEHAGSPSAAIVTVGTELTAGLAIDSNGPEIALVLESAGHIVGEILSLPDDEALLRASLVRLMAEYSLVIVTGGLGPTHDDITRQAAAQALHRALVRDPGRAEALVEVVARHAVPGAKEQVLRQADVVEGARIITPVVGTAPGQVIAHDRGTLVLLPGPPREMRPMLAEVVNRAHGRAAARIVRTVGLPESEAQVRAGAVIGAAGGIGFTVLATPGLVDVVLRDTGAGPETLGWMADEVAHALGDACYSTDGATLAGTVVTLATDRGVTLASAESCTGGMVAAALTDVPGASAVFRGTVVAYADDVKVRALGVGPALLATHGAVSAEVARDMAEGVRARLGSDLAVAVTGVAGPGGGSAAKPVGTVWFALATAGGTTTLHRAFGGDREIVRARATVTALDMLRRAIEAVPADDRRR